MSRVLASLEPGKLWEIFEEITKIPHCSKHEEAMAAYLQQTAKDAGLECLQDQVGNLVVRIPATPGRENAPAVALQGHMDMVCEKNADKDFDFCTDPLELVIDGDWLKASGTTLGSDNGVGLAAALAVALDPSIIHGPLEILATVDEESGLTGAMGLTADLLRSRLLLNLDSEETNKIYIGCAGGGGVNTRLPLKATATAAGLVGGRLTVKGLAGGHSGLDIILNRGNAIKLLVRALYDLTPLDASLCEMWGGDKHNAIPREAWATLVLPADSWDAARASVNKNLDDFRREYPNEPNLLIALEDIDAPATTLFPESHNAVLNLLLGYPDGVLAMSREVPGLVETSNNLASVKMEGGFLQCHNSPRSSNDVAIRGLLDQIQAIGKLAGAANEEEDSYPGWQPDMASPVLKLARQVHRELFDVEPEAAAIHAGLECGIIGEKFSGMDMISFGPDIRHPHSPDERVNIPSVDRFWNFLVALLDAVATGRLEQK